MADFPQDSTTNLSARRYNFPAQLFVGKNRKFGTIKRIVKKSLKFDSSTHQPRTARIRPRLGAILVFHKKRAIELRYAIKRTLFPRFLIQKSYYSKMPPISESLLISKLLSQRSTIVRESMPTLQFIQIGSYRSDQMFQEQLSSFLTMIKSGMETKKLKIEITP